MADFAKLFHSSMLDTERLAQPLFESEKRRESALKYISLWASSKVNINTAPRHVLEAAFIFGGDETEIAEAIIERRRLKPFESIEELKNELRGYFSSIEKSERFITTNSDVFTIRVTATSGVARASAVIAILKEGRKVNRIAVMSG
jgi:type II secretory pathway component PulK